MVDVIGVLTTECTPQENRKRNVKTMEPGTILEHACKDPRCRYRGRIAKILVVEDDMFLVRFLHSKDIMKLKSSEFIPVKIPAELKRNDTETLAHPETPQTD